MTLRELMSRLRHLSEQDGFDADGEVFVTLFDEDQDRVKDLSISKVDWVWSDPVDEGNFEKLVTIMADSKGLA